MQNDNEPRPSPEREETLDPEDWQAMRRLAHQMVDDMFDYQESRRETPVWQPVPPQVKQALDQTLPQQPQGADAAYAAFRQCVLPYGPGNDHPRFWGWVVGSGSVLGMLADMLASGMNPNMGGGEHAPIYVEKQVIAWCKEMLGFPAAGSGLLVSGASMANLIGLTVARDTMLGAQVRERGVCRLGQQATFYGSAEMHSSIDKALHLLGMGTGALRRIPTDSKFRIDIESLIATIASDRAAGYRPVCIIGSAGTVNTGAFDDLEAVAEVCRREGLWFHVDGAFGALAALAPSLRHLVCGMDRADSLAFDMHKWMSMPYEVGCVLVRRESAHRRVFSLSPPYLARQRRGLAAGPAWFSEYGLQLSRSFRALKVWMSLKAHGVEKYGRLIQQNVLQARYLAALIDEAPALERLAPVSLHIVCFRFVGSGSAAPDLNEVNEEILLRLHERGIALPTYTVLNGRFALRAAITNHRTRKADLDDFVAAVVALGEEVMAQ